MNEPCFYRVSVKGIVIDEAGRLLLAREDDGTWEMLGGGLDHGEDPIEGLKRELREEAGLIVTSVSAAPKYFLAWQEGGIWRANVIYQIELADLNFTPSEECQELRFFSPEEIRQVKHFPNVQKLYELLTHD